MIAKSAILPTMKPAPLFCLPDQHDTEHCLAQYQGRWVVLYFYPKDETPGCTKQACTLRDNWEAFEKQGVVVLGISKDSTASHKKFAENHKLPFPLLSDTEKTTMQAYDVFKKKTIFGKSALGVSRDAFLINPEGMIYRTYKNTAPGTFAETVLSDLPTE